MKKSFLVSAVLFCACTLLFCGCNKNDESKSSTDKSQSGTTAATSASDSSDSDNSDSSGSDVSELSGLEALEEKMLAADSTLPVMSSVNGKMEDAEDLFSFVSTISYDKVEDFFVTYSADGTAEEIAVILLKDEDDVDEAVDSLKKHRTSRVNLYKTYAPEEVEAAENALIFSKGKMAVYIACDNQNDVKQAFNDNAG